MLTFKYYLKIKKMVFFLFLLINTAKKNYFVEIVDYMTKLCETFLRLNLCDEVSL